ncbi:hypothetical protein [Roseateles asaccharophilus]|uniref:Helix-turn-helix domain-containing protein n=1 Tax=Roseateles asaccharophilus TaxID=582607 RepID=A0ABU2A3I3_9BURK|nr:hypothetical protein [Roseateles asaccharophilus]MDR7331746.1 hypothetical protein [Roseateles asaccharophilus]
MRGSALNDWTRAVHAHCRSLTAQAGRPVGVTVEEALAACGAPPALQGCPSRILQRAAVRGWFTGEREIAEGRWRGCKVRVRYYAAAALPPAAPRPEPASYFDGLVRASSVFELARIVGERARGGA